MNVTYVAPAQTYTQVSSCPNGSYINSAGNEVCRPCIHNNGGATVIFMDWTYSYRGNLSETWWRGAVVVEL